MSIFEPSVCRFQLLFSVYMKLWIKRGPGTRRHLSLVNTTKIALGGAILGLLAGGTEKWI